MFDPIPAIYQRGQSSSNAWTCSLAHFNLLGYISFILTVLWVDGITPIIDKFNNEICSNEKVL